MTGKPPGKTRGIFICITGLDGAGKTTASKRLVELLGQENIQARYQYSRYVPHLLLPLLKVSQLLFLRKKDQFKDYSAHRQSKQKATARHPFLSRIYRATMLTDYVGQIFFKITLPRAFGRNIVCDRYVYDTVVTDLYVDFGYTVEQAKAVLRRLMRFVPTPDAIYYIDIDPEVAFKRKDDVPSVEYLRERHIAYLAVAAESGMKKVDGTLPPHEVHARIMRDLSATLRLDAPATSGDVRVQPPKKS